MSFKSFKSIKQRKIEMDNKWKILIIDDEIKIINSLVKILRNELYDIYYTTNAEEAFTLIREIDMDLIISDQKMPYKTGLDILVYAKQNSPDTIRILMTGYEDIDTTISAINKGSIYYYISKPWKNEEVTKIVRMAISHKKDQDANKFIINQFLKEKEDWETAINSLQQRYNYKTEESIQLLSKIMEVKDKDLYDHGNRVSRYALQIGKYLNLSKQKKESIKLAGLFHDIGKIAIKDRIMYKPAALDFGEFKEIKKHPIIGSEILKQLSYMKESAKIVLQHHERIDGTGYPLGLKGDEIMLEAQIVAIADSFDALTSKRVYRREMNNEEAISIIKREKESHFRGYLVEILEELINIKEKIQ